jgi:hypothetical protein
MTAAMRKLQTLLSLPAGNLKSTIQGIVAKHNSRCNLLETRTSGPFSIRIIPCTWVSGDLPVRQGFMLLYE